jgi:hypothetical protein
MDHLRHSTKKLRSNILPYKWFNSNRHGKRYETQSQQSTSSFGGLQSLYLLSFHPPTTFSTRQSFYLPCGHRGPLSGIIAVSSTTTPSSLLNILPYLRYAIFEMCFYPSFGLSRIQSLLIPSLTTSFYQLR